jgi:hypothetical protein
MEKPSWSSTHRLERFRCGRIFLDQKAYLGRINEVALYGGGKHARQSFQEALRPVHPRRNILHSGKSPTEYFKKQETLVLGIQSGLCKFD